MKSQAHQVAHYVRANSNLMTTLIRYEIPESDEINSKEFSIPLRGIIDAAWLVRFELVSP
jgi:hypothetical protein